MQGDKGVPGISCGLVSDNIFEWEVMLMISDDCKYYGGIYSSHFPRYSRPLANERCSYTTGGFYRAHLTFPPEYPLLPPKMTFQSPIFHPNSTPPPLPSPNTPFLTTPQSTPPATSASPSYTPQPPTLMATNPPRSAGRPYRHQKRFCCL